MSKDEAGKVGELDDLAGCEELILRRPVPIGSDEVDPVAWFASLSEERGWSSAEIGREVGYDASVVSRVFRGKYTGDMEQVSAAFQNARVRLLGPSMGCIIETVASNSIEEALRDSAGSPFMTVVYGPPGIGKTESIARWTMKRRGAKSLLVTLDHGVTSGSLLQEVATALGIPSGGFSSLLLKRVAEELRRQRRLLIVDEANNLARRLSTASSVLNTLRQLNDLSSCGLVLCGTVNLFDLIFSPKSRGDMEMIRSRVGLEYELPAAGRREVAALLVAHFGEEVYRERVLSEAVFAGPFKRGEEGSLSMRHGCVFVQQARRMMARSGVKSLTPRIASTAWSAIRRHH